MKAQKQIPDNIESSSISYKKKKRITCYPSNINIDNNTRRKAKQLEQKVHHTTKQRQKVQEPIPSYLPKKRVDRINQRQNIKQNEKDIGIKIENQKLSINTKNISSLREDFLNGNSNINLSDLDIVTLNQLMDNLREYSSHCVLQRQYDEAEQANSLYERVKEEVQMLNLNKNENCENDHGDEDDIPYIELKKAKMQQFKDELENYDRITIKKRQELEEKLLKDIEMFEDNWKENMPRKYRKPSSKLIVLYEIERKFGLTGQFQEAKKIKIEADKLQSIEMAQAQQRLVHDYSIAKNQFDKQQAKEREIFEDTRNHWRSVVIARQKVEMEAIKNRKTVLSVKQTEPKVVKESSMDQQAKLIDQCSNGGAAVYRKENVAPRDILLPPLIAPNDDKMKELKIKEIELQKTRNQQFRANQKLRELEEDSSEKSSPRFNSPRSDFLLPTPSIKIQKNDKNKLNREIIQVKANSPNTRIKIGYPRQSDYSSISDTYSNTDNQLLNIHLDVDQVRNILQERIRTEINDSSYETAETNYSNENAEVCDDNNNSNEGTSPSVINEEFRKSITFQLTETENFK